MRKSLFAAIAIGLGASGAAQAVYLNPHGLGQVLVYPYYTINAGQSTLMTVVNTTARGKALRLRIHEGYNGRYVLAFNIYLSPFDVWSAEIGPNSEFADNDAEIATSDTSCTVPYFSHVAFRNLDYAGQNNDTGPEGFARAREGHFDIIEMGEVTNGTNGTLDAISHVDGDAPADCTKVTQAWVNGYWSADPTIDMAPPGGGLYGTESIIDVAQGTIYTIDAAALDGFSATIQHTIASSNDGPDLDTANDAAGADTVTAFVPVGAKMLAAKYQRPVDAVSAVLMADSLYNEYEVDPAIGATSDWVVTFPTKHFYVDLDENPGVNAISNPPFDEKFGATVPGKSCSPIGLRVYDRDELTTTVGFPGTSPNIVLPTLCFETNVLPIKSAISLLGSQLLDANDLLGSQLPFAAGHIAASLVNSADAAGNVSADPAHALSASANGYVFKGMPAIGFLARSYINANVTPGVLANYSGLIPHRASVTCTTSTSPASACQ